MCRLHMVQHAAKLFTDTHTSSRLTFNVTGLPPGSKESVLSLAKMYCEEVTGSYTEPTDKRQARECSTILPRSR